MAINPTTSSSSPHPPPPPSLGEGGPLGGPSGVSQATPTAESGKGFFGWLRDLADRALGRHTSQPAVPVTAQQPTPTLASVPESPTTQAAAAAAGPAPRELPPGSYDVGHVTKQQLDGLRASSDPKDHRLAATIERSQTAYRDILSQGGEIIANRQEGNGGNPVVTILPPGFDPNRETRVHTHYHGYNSTVAEPPGKGAGLTPRIQDIQARDRESGQQTVFVLPEAANAPDQGGAYKTDWSRVKSQTATTAGALEAAGVTHTGYSVVSAHSGGGEALRAAITHTPNGEGLKCDRLELQDCLYGAQSSINAWAATPDGQAAKQVVYFQGTNSNGADAGFSRSFPGRYQHVQVAAPGPHDIPTVHDLSGREVPAYGASSHNRTKAQYLDFIPDA